MNKTPLLPQDNLTSTPNVSRMRPNIWMDYLLTKNKDWVKILLLELNENATELTDDAKVQSSELNLHMKLKKATNDTYGDYLLCDLRVESHFNTHCSKSGTPMKDSLNFEVKMCFLEQENSEKEEFKDLTEHYTDGEIYELYFLNAQSEAPLDEAIHEQLFLNIDYYPVQTSVEK